MIAVMGILALAVTVGIDRGKADLEVAGIRLRSDIQFAQDLAMTHGSTYGFDRLTSTSYEIFEGSPGSPATDPLTLDDYIIDISPAAFFWNTPTISFLASGRPDITSNKLIILRDGNAYRLLVVESDTGYIRLYRLQL